MVFHTYKSTRRGGIYIAVLATALMVSLLGIAALVAQRLQNRMVVASANITQAQINANSAVEFALLTMKQDTAWRSNQTNGTWVSNRIIGTYLGGCTASVTDPLDANLADDASEPVVIRGMGTCGNATQRFEVTIDPRRDALTCLRSAVAAGDIDLQSDTLRTDGTITATSSSAASSSHVYGDVHAVSISGSTYHGATTTINASKLPTMPDWSSAFSYYKTNGTEILIGNLPTSTPNMGRNINIEGTLSTNDWNGVPPSGLGTATLQQSNNQNHTTGGTYSLRVRDRTVWYAGATQPIDGYVKSGQQYTVDAYVIHSSLTSKIFYISLYTKGSGSVQFNVGPDVSVSPNTWTKVSATITAPAWSGSLEYAYVKVAGDSANTVDFYLDDLNVKETTTGRLIYQKVISPSLNPFGASTNSQGIYWINCGGNKIVLERSRILGTLLIINPGAGSCIANGPMAMSPAVAGYPALLVDADNAADADFGIYATKRGLSEKENAVNFNPAGAAHDEFGTDSDTNDIYQSVIEGLVAIRDDLTFQNTPLIRGQLIVGDDISNSSGTLEVQFQPYSLLNPPPGFFGTYTYARRTTSARKYVP